VAIIADTGALVGAPAQLVAQLQQPYNHAAAQQAIAQQN